MVLIYLAKALLPTITADIIGSRKVKEQANILLDTGAQVSLIRKPVAEELDLEGKDVTMTLAKVGGEAIFPFVNDRYPPELALPSRVL
jgi:hypothetical protein